MPGVSAARCSPESSDGSSGNATVVGGLCPPSQGRFRSARTAQATRSSSRSCFTTSPTTARWVRATSTFRRTFGRPCRRRARAAGSRRARRAGHPAPPVPSTGTGRPCGGGRVSQTPDVRFVVLLVLLAIAGIVIGATAFAQHQDQQKNNSATCASDRDSLKIERGLMAELRSNDVRYRQPPGDHEDVQLKIAAAKSLLAADHC
jgi:hypothetical protein